MRNAAGQINFVSWLSENLQRVYCIIKVRYLVKEEWVNYLTAILREVDKEVDQETEGWTVCKQVLLNVKLQILKRGQ